MTRFDMRANYVDVLKPRIPHENFIIRFKSGHGVLADISLSHARLADLREKLIELEAEE